MLNSSNFDYSLERFKENPIDNNGIKIRVTLDNKILIETKFGINSFEKILKPVKYAAALAELGAITNYELFNRFHNTNMVKPEIVASQIQVLKRNLSNGSKIIRSEKPGYYYIGDLRKHRWENPKDFIQVNGLRLNLITKIFENQDDQDKSNYTILTKLETEYMKNLMKPEGLVSISELYIDERSKVKHEIRRLRKKISNIPSCEIKTKSKFGYYLILE